MNVLHLTLSFEPGGRRRAIETLADGGKQTGFNSYLCCLTHLGCDPEETEGRFLETDSLNKTNLLSVSVIRRLNRIIARDSIDVLHSHDGASLFLGSASMLGGRRIGHITTFHRSLDIETATLKGKIRNAVALTQCDLVHTASEERKEHYLKSNWVNPKKVFTQPLGVDTKSFQYSASARDTIRAQMGISEHDLVFGAVGHFGREKGVDLVVSAFVEVANEKSDCHLFVVGTGDSEQRERLSKLADSHASRIHFLGYRTDVPKVMSAMDIFVHGARQEAFGLVLAEALSNGRPVIATNTGGARQILNTEVGVLVPREDVRAMRQAMIELSAAPKKRESMAIAAVSRAHDCFSVSSYAENIQSRYKELLR